MCARNFCEDNCGRGRLAFYPSGDGRLDLHLRDTAQRVLLRAAEDQRLTTLTAWARALGVSRERLGRYLDALDLRDEWRRLQRQSRNAAKNAKLDKSCIAD